MTGFIKGQDMDYCSQGCNMGQFIAEPCKPSSSINSKIAAIRLQYQPAERKGE